jgi:hypothetical protein
MMKRGDGTKFTICNGCGTIPIYNESEGFYVCPLCDGPIQYAGENASNLELLPPNKRSLATFSTVEMPYVVKLLEQELSTYMNIGMRFLTNKNLQHFPGPDMSAITDEQLEEYAKIELPEFVLPEYHIPERLEPVEEITARPEDLAALGVPVPKEEVVLEVSENEMLDSQQPQLQVVVQTVPPAVVPVLQGQPLATVLQQQPQQTAMPGEEMVQVAPLPPAQPPPQQPITYVPMVPAFNPTAQVLPPAIPGAPQTVVVDTSPQTMAALGFDDEGAVAGLSMRPRTSQNGGNRTRKAVRFSQAQQGTLHAAPPPQSSSNVRVSVMKLGS